MESATDAELVARCLANEQGAWEELVDRYARYVYAIAARVYRLDPNLLDAGFLVVCAGGFAGPDRLGEVAARRPWIAKTPGRCAIDALRRAGRETAVDELPDGVDEGLAELDEAMTVHAALDGLSPDCREILDRFFTRDESYRTIGSELDLPPGTIASRIARCLARLRDALDPDLAHATGRNAPVRASGEKVRRRR